MAQETGKILPQFINTDKSYDKLKPDESPYIKGLTWDISANPGDTIGTSNPSGEGQNLLVLTPVRSNEQLAGVSLPDTGWNKSMGTFESVLTKELYHFNYNSSGNHGIYVIDGNSGVSAPVVIDPKLGFTDNQENVATTRVMLRYVKDENGNISEKHLLWSDGQKWQGWVNVIAAIATSGFDSSLFPYWTLLPPHFDRRELLEWPVRPPMIKPVISIIQNTAADLGKINRVADKNFRFAYDFINTDGRISTLSPYSLPLQIKTEEYLNNIDNLPKRAKLKLYAGSPLTEKMRIYVQRADATNSIDPTAVYGDWILYDTIEKFDINSSGEYWKRTNPWSSFNYDPVFNTIEYEFDNSKTGTIISQTDAMRLQTAMPQLSQAATDIDDAVLLCNNRYGYNNLSKGQLGNMSAIVKEKTLQTCSAPMRTVYLYAYLAQCGSDFTYTSQVGYYMGTDKQVRFGGLRMGTSPITKATIDVNESKFYQLDFSDKKALRVYLKGTPYYADGEWCIVKTDNSIEVIDSTYDFNNEDTLIAVQDIFKSGSYFMCRFKLNIPAGRYIATIGRHNVSSSGDYKNTSTYIYGIANSRAKGLAGAGLNGLVTVKPTAIRSYSKEMEIDCISGDLDVWGNSNDLFYIYSPYNKVRRNGKYRFIEGYFQQSPGTPLPVELFPYQMNHAAADDWGKFTDKNGFYWAFTKVANAESVDIQFFAKVNCNINTAFTIPTSQTGSGWKKNNIAFLSNHGGGASSNWIVYNGRITDLSGNIGYSNIAVSLKDGATVYTRADGTFTMFVHNGQPTTRTSNVYVNAGGNFLITLANCTPLPLSVFDEALAPCMNYRIYPVPLNLRVMIQNNTQTSLKAGKYTVGCVVADLAGRMTFVNNITELDVTSFLQRNNINATYIQLLISAALRLNPDFKWFSPYVSKNVAIKRQTQWIGDKLIYLDNSGNIVTDPVAASFVKIIIKSLYDANVTNNFSLLSSYQFTKGDRLRVLDDGNGRLLSVASFGNPIDVQVLGTNYNQAAINAGIVPGTVNTNQSTDVGLIVRYDQRFDMLADKTGFWIEIFTPIQENEVVPMFETAGFYPIINGEVSEFAGYNNGQPVYNTLTSIDIDFWDTYFLQRSISGKYFSHPFESENVTDNWGKNITSGGRINVENKEASQQWFGGDVIRSDSFLTINGLATFRDENRKNYGVYPFGEIVAAHTKRNIVAFNCSSDWFVAEFNMPYTKVANGQLVITNLDENLSLPRQKGGPMFGLEKEDLETVVIDDDFFFWFDRKNTAFVKCNYLTSVDVSQETGNEGAIETQQFGNERGGIQSYLNMKTYFINQWNNSHERKYRFDVVAGIDGERGNIYLTFRPRKNNSNNPKSYISNVRNLNLGSPETFVYSIQYKGWIPCQHFAPEAYARLRGKWANVEMFTFAGGVPFFHNNTENNSFLKFYGIQCEPVVMVSMNEKDYVKIFGSMSFNCHGSTLFVDYVFDEQTNCFSYIPLSQWKEKEHITYAPFFRNMVTFPPTNPDELYRSMLFDGKRIFGDQAVCRLVQKYEELGTYFQLSDISYLFTNSHPTKP